MLQMMLGAAKTYEVHGYEVAQEPCTNGLVFPVRFFRIRSASSIPLYRFYRPPVLSIATARSVNEDFNDSTDRFLGYNFD